MTAAPLLRLRARAITGSLFRPTTLAAALQRLAFVQADPIRSPARAQDLILRQRVTGYRVDALERRYASLDIEEDVLYAYGFVSRATWRLLHPRRVPRLKPLERQILEVVRGAAAIHPGELDARFGRARVVNAWGGYSRATKHALERLHHYGLVRIARRDQGIRVYRVMPYDAPEGDPIAPRERTRALVSTVVAILAPASEATVHAILARLRRHVLGVEDSRAALRALLAAGELERETVGGVAYVWPAGREARAVPPRVRLLAPFDPLVWDRRRFEQLWGWAYRFEAYTPPARRVRGYYAMPLLWGERMIGWGNASVVDGQLDVACGFVDKRPRDRAFAAELDREIERLRAFLARP
jgi:uncharacterized protein YcaQ